jgi:hypothetical protein
MRMGRRLGNVNVLLRAGTILKASFNCQRRKQGPSLQQSNTVSQEECLHISSNFNNAQY